MWRFVRLLLDSTLSGAVTDDTDTKPSRKGRKARRDEHDGLVRWKPRKVVTMHMDMCYGATVSNTNSMSLDITVFTS